MYARIVGEFSFFSFQPPMTRLISFSYNNGTPMQVFISHKETLYRLVKDGEIILFFRLPDLRRVPLKWFLPA